MIVTLNKRNIITISKEMREELGLEPGDSLSAKVEKGQLVLTPVSIVPRSLKLSAKGVKKESEADEDVMRGRVRRFGDTKDLLKDLNENRKN